MGVQFSRAAILDIEAKYRALGPAAEAMMDTELGAIAEAGKDAVIEGIYAASTPYGESQGHQGRSDPSRAGAGEDIVSAVAVRKIPIADPTVRIWEFGWLDTFPDYFKFQEGGFMHAGANGKFVEGMHALRDASTAARVKMKRVGPTIIAKLARLAP